MRKASEYAPWGWPRPSPWAIVKCAAALTGIATWAYGLYRLVAWLLK